MTQLPECCPHCKSNKIRISATYKDSSYCPDCGKGEKLSEMVKAEAPVEKKQEDKTNKPLDMYDPRFTHISRDQYGNVIDIVTWDI